MAETSQKNSFAIFLHYKLKEKKKKNNYINIYTVSVGVNKGSVRI